MAKVSKIKITLVKSLIGTKVGQIATAEALGLRKPGDVTITDSYSSRFDRCFKRRCRVYYAYKASV